MRVYILPKKENLQANGEFIAYRIYSLDVQTCMWKFKRTQMLDSPKLPKIIYLPIANPDTKFIITPLIKIIYYLFKRKKILNLYLRFFYLFILNFFFFYNRGRDLLLNINIIKKTAVLPVPFERHIWCCFTYNLCLLRWRFGNAV